MVLVLYFDLANLIFLATLFVVLRVFVYSYVNVMNALQMNWRSWPQWSASKLHEAGNISHLLTYHIHSCTKTYLILIFLVFFGISIDRPRGAINFFFPIPYLTMMLQWYSYWYVLLLILQIVACNAYPAIMLKLYWYWFNTDILAIMLQQCWYCYWYQFCQKNILQSKLKLIDLKEKGNKPAI